MIFQTNILIFVVCIIEFWLMHSTAFLKYMLHLDTFWDLEQNHFVYIY